MNTRLQVEHPVTEAIFGVDLVREQIRVAAGERMDFAQEDLQINGHAIEVRINAEKLPNFSPSPGRITQYHAPGGLGVRMDCALYDGYRIPPYYDSLIGKLIVHGRDRPEALARLRRALGELIVDGIDTTVPLFHALLEEPDIQAGDYDIHWLEHWLEPSSSPEPRAAPSMPRPDAGAAAGRLCRGHLPDGRRPRRPRASSGSIRESRGIIPLDGFHISRSLRRRILRGRLPRDAEHATSRAWSRGCADRQETWINDTIFELYQTCTRRAAPTRRGLGGRAAGRRRLWRGAWRRVLRRKHVLARARDASKIALAYLVDRLRQQRLHAVRHAVPDAAPGLLGAVEISAGGIPPAAGRGADARRRISNGRADARASGGGAAQHPDVVARMVQRVQRRARRDHPAVEDPARPGRRSG